MIILGGNSCEKLTNKVSANLGLGLTLPVIKRFPDGEKYVRIEADVYGEEVILIQSITSPHDENLVELLMLLDAAKSNGGSITTVIPYYGYGRQDRAFNPGEAVSSRVVANHVQLYSEKVITINPHKEHILDYFAVPTTSIDAAPLIGKYFKGLKLDNPVVVAPDKGSVDMARRVSDVLGCRCENCSKKRLGPGKVVTSAENLNLNGEDVIIVDDIIDSGGTIIEACKVLKERGAGSIHVACVHPVLTNNAGEKILKHADGLVATDTIKTPYSKISIAGLIVQELKKSV